MTSNAAYAIRPDLKNRHSQFVKQASQHALQGRIENLRQPPSTPRLQNFFEFSLTHLESYTSEALKNKILEWLSTPVESDTLASYIQAVRSSDIFDNHFGVIGLRKTLVKQQHAVLQNVIDSDCIACIVNFVERGQYLHLVFEAGWCLANLTIGDKQQTELVVSKNVVPTLLKLAQSPYPQIAEQAVWALGNISAESTQLRELLLCAGAISALDRVYQQGHSTLCKYTTWIFSNICTKRPEYEHIDRVFVPFSRLVDYVVQFSSATWEDLEDCVIGIRGALHSANLTLIEDWEFFSTFIDYFFAFVEDPLYGQNHLLAALELLNAVNRQSTMWLSFIESVDVLKGVEKLLLARLSAALRKEACCFLALMAGSSLSFRSSMVARGALMTVIFELAARGDEENGKNAFEVIGQVANHLDREFYAMMFNNNILELINFYLMAESEDAGCAAMRLCRTLLGNSELIGIQSSVVAAFIASKVPELISLKQLSPDINSYLQAFSLLEDFFPSAN